MANTERPTMHDYKNCWGCANLICRPHELQLEPVPWADKPLAWHKACYAAAIAEETTNA